MTTDLIWLLTRAFLGAVILTPICRDIFRSYGVVDCPDQGRKLHSQPIPRVGGIAILISYFFAFVINWPDGVVMPQIALIWRLLPAALVIFAVGLIDDFLSLKPWQKLIGQVVGAGLAYLGGVHIEWVGGNGIPGWCGLPVTIIWLLVCTNAFNLVDGLDGLAAGLGFFATATIFSAAMLGGNKPLAYATLPLAGALLGFLCYNFNPATIFLGDSGSLLTGFLLGCYGVVWIQKSVTLLSMTAPLMAMALPLLDVLLCVVRRFLRKKPIFGADRGHIHHRLLDRGLSPRQVVTILYTISGLAAAFSIVQNLVQDVYVTIPVVLLFCALAWMGIQYLGYAELILAGKVLRAGQLQQIIQTHLTLDGFQARIGGARTVEEVWTVIERSYRDLGFDAVRLFWGTEVFETSGAGTGAAQGWTVRVPLAGENHIEFTRRTRHSAESTVPVVVDLDMLSGILNAALPAAASQAAVAESAILHGRI